MLVARGAPGGARALVGCTCGPDGGVTARARRRDRSRVLVGSVASDALAVSVNLDPGRVALPPQVASRALDRFGHARSRGLVARRAPRERVARRAVRPGLRTEASACLGGRVLDPCFPLMARSAATGRDVAEGIARELMTLHTGDLFPDDVDLVADHGARGLPAGLDVHASPRRAVGARAPVFRASDDHGRDERRDEPRRSAAMQRERAERPDQTSGRTERAAPPHGPARSGARATGRRRVRHRRAVTGERGSRRGRLR
jgi:hypothetical protein